MSEGSEGRKGEKDGREEGRKGGKDGRKEGKEGRKYGWVEGWKEGRRKVEERKLKEAEERKGGVKKRRKLREGTEGREEGRILKKRRREGH